MHSRNCSHGQSSAARAGIVRDDLPTATAFSAAADHVSFALGRHFCVGALLAKTEIEVAVDALLDAMPDLALADGPVPTERGVFTRGPASFPVTFTVPNRPADC
ncbi:hypothetical protein [Nocardia flavorosea]|uniref:hypothetical protein n=1 Tax=Nocardia flavorosea TaxID=53429 RepID=UPI000A46ACC3|nr:hypothetical protein [Nocardia flavorosea]